MATEAGSPSQIQNGFGCSGLMLCLVRLRHFFLKIEEHLCEGQVTFYWNISRQASKKNHGTHSNCCGALCFYCDALCKVPVKIYIFLIQVLLRGKFMCPFKSEVQGLSRDTKAMTHLLAKAKSQKALSQSQAKQPSIH